MTLWQMSDRAIPRSFRMMQGFGAHLPVRQRGRESTFVKFHWTPSSDAVGGVERAVKINGADPDFHRRDLFDAISRGDFPQWELGIQVFDDAFADEFDFDVLDATKIILEEPLPVRPVGRMTLNRVVDNVFAEIEQVAFMTQNVPPGIDFSNDPCSRAATSPTSTPSSSGWAARTSARSRSTHHAAWSPTSSGTATDVDARPGDVRAQLVHRRRPRPARGRPDGHVPYPAEVSGDAPDPGGLLADHYSQAWPVLDQPDAGRAGPHRRGLRLRARQVRGPGDPHADGRQPPGRGRVARLPVAAGLGMPVPPASEAAAPSSWRRRCLEHPRQRQGDLRGRAGPARG